MYREIIHQKDRWHLIEQTIFSHYQLLNCNTLQRCQGITFFVINRIHVVFTWEYAGFYSKLTQSCTYSHLLRIWENTVPKHPVFTIVLHGEFSQESSIIDTAQKMEFSINDFFSKYDQICSFLRIWSHFLKKSLMENLIICTVRYLTGSSIRLWDYTSTLYLFWRIILNSEFHILAKPMVTGIQNRI